MLMEQIVDNERIELKFSQQNIVLNEGVFHNLNSSENAI